MADFYCLNCGILATGMSGFGNNNCCYCEWYLSGECMRCTNLSFPLIKNPLFRDSRCQTFLMICQRCLSAPCMHRGECQTSGCQQLDNLAQNEYEDQLRSMAEEQISWK